jgi:hypothetical protein
MWSKEKGSVSSKDRCEARYTVFDDLWAPQSEDPGGGSTSSCGEIQQRLRGGFRGWEDRNRGHGKCQGSYWGSWLRPKLEILEKSGFTARSGVLHRSDWRLKKSRCLTSGPETSVKEGKKGGTGPACWFGPRWGEWEGRGAGHPHLLAGPKLALVGGLLVGERAAVLAWAEAERGEWGGLRARTEGIVFLFLLFCFFLFISKTFPNS